MARHNLGWMANYKKHRRSAQASSQRRRFYPRMETLEARHLLTTFTVDTVEDDEQLQGSLRWAIEQANSDTTADEIIFAESLDGQTILLDQSENGVVNAANQQLDITKSLTINAGALTNGITIEARDPTPSVANGDGSRIFKIEQGDINVSLIGLTLVGGDVAGYGSNNAGTRGGAVFFRGAGGSNSNLTIQDSTITGNRAFVGGGVYAAFIDDDGNDSRSITIENSTITDNHAYSSSSSDVVKGGGLYLRQWHADHKSTIVGSTISGNTASGTYGGGGVFSWSEEAGTLDITDSTICDNHTTASGGGVHCAAKYGRLEIAVRICNTTLSGNTSEDYVYGGGGIRFMAGIHHGDADVAAEIRNVTITNNTCDSESSGGGGISIGNDVHWKVDLHNTIVSGNQDDDGNPDDIGGEKDLTEASSYNLVGTGGSGGLQNGVLGNIVDEDNPGLNPLAHWGGPTRTHALTHDSPALDAGDPNDVAGQNGVPLFDQRGNPFSRVRDGDADETARIDIGAYELQDAASGSGPWAPKVVAVIVSGSTSKHVPSTVPAGSGEQLRTVPVGGADAITVAFDRGVYLAEASMTLKGYVTSDPGVTVYSPTTFVHDESNNPSWGTWTFTTFPADMMELTVLDSVTAIAGNSKLDGNWTNPEDLFEETSSAFPSGDGEEDVDDDFVFRFTILPGDANRDNIVGLTDIGIMQTNHHTRGRTFEQGDFSGDGLVTNEADYYPFIRAADEGDVVNFGKIWVWWDKDDLVGDIDESGSINGLDVAPFIALVFNDPENPLGDMNDDDAVNGLDIQWLVASITSGGLEHMVQAELT